MCTALTASQAATTAARCCRNCGALRSRQPPPQTDVHAAMDDKDRRSRMATSTMHAPAKKGGAGGQWTWGGAADVRDYEPSGLVGSKVTVVPVQPPSQAMGHVISANSKGVNIESTTQFPSLPTGQRAPKLAKRGDPVPPSSVAQFDPVVTEAAPPADAQGKTKKRGLKCCAWCAN